MSSSRRRFSAVAGISILSVFFLALSYTRHESNLSPVMDNEIAIQKDLIERDITGSGAVVYGTSKLETSKTQEQNNNKKKDNSKYFKQSRMKLLGKLSNTKVLSAIKNIGEKSKPQYYPSKMNTKPSSVNHYSQKASNDSESASSGADQLYDEVLTTTEGSIENTVPPLSIYSASANDIKNRKYQYWLSGNSTLPYNASLVTQQQLERKKKIHETCQTPNVIDVLHTPAEGHRSSFFLHEHLLYCPILKAGSTNILRLMCWLLGPPCSLIEHLMPHNMVPRYMEKGHQIAMGNSPKFLSYFSFALVRNPWKRLVSVYIQKFVETRQGLGFCGIRDRFPKLFRYYRKHKDARMKFKDYIDKCVIGQYEEGGILEQNGHWRPQYHMCSFCHLDFTFIGKIETMKSDERVILNAFGFSDIDKTIADASSHLLPNEKANKTTLLYEDLWNSIDAETIEYLRKLYSIDLEMFDYPAHPLTK